MKTLITILLFIGLSFPQSFGKNKVQYDNFDWEYIVSPNTNIYYYGDNYDLAVIGDFASPDDYLVYASHPKHLEVISELLAPYLEGRSAVQYECDAE